MSHVLLAHAPEAEARASAVAKKLSALGFEVRRRPRAPGLAGRRKLTAAIDGAGCVLVLSPADPTLRAAARRARAAGKLVRWNAGDNGRAWRNLAASVRAAAAPAAPAPRPKPRARNNNGAFVLGFVGLYAILCAGAYYLLP